MSKSANTTHFGYREVPVEEKTGMVREVFDSVASRYDLMNDLMSMGVHRLWKRHFVGTSGVQPGDHVLDLASGTGDIASLLSRRVGASGQVVMSDINGAMLGVGRRRMIDQGRVGNIRYALANAEQLPFADRQFDAVTIAFGLRNVTDQPAALAEMRRVLKPGGKVMILEFSRVGPEPLRRAYDAYSFTALPVLGKLVTNDADSYQYLAESIRKHPSQEELAELMEAAGFKRVGFRNMSAGVVAIHRGQRG